MEHGQMRRRVAAARVGRLATIGADRRPHLVPCCFALAGDVVYSAVDAKPKRSADLRRLANIRAEPAACLLVDGYDEDWSRLWWVRLDGHAAVLPEQPDAMALLAAKYPQYAEEPPGGPVIALTVSRWSGWSPVPSGQ